MLARQEFYYGDVGIRARCETSAVLIRRRNKDLLEGIVAIGEELITVKELLSHGQWGDWLVYQFNMSISTSENYMNAARAVNQFPNLWEYDPSVLYLFTRTLPASAARAITSKGPVTVEKARDLIRDCKGGEWYEEVSGIIDEDPGGAYQRITWAIGDPNLNEYAIKLLRENTDTFAHHASREGWEVQKEAGVEVLDRIGSSSRPIPPTLYLTEGEHGHRIQLWVDGADPEDVAVLPASSAAGQAWQRAMLEVIMASSILRIRTADDVVEL